MLKPKKYYNVLSKTISDFFRDKYFVLALIIFAIGTFLRFYKINEYTTFLGDQGRDAIIIKRIIKLEHLPLIGPPSSVGQVYLGPFYYYFIAPWLLVFNFNPLGLAFGTAILSSFSIMLIWIVVSYIFNKKVGLVTEVLYATSSVLIEFSRFSWNPNLLPAISIFCLFFLYRTLKKGYLIDFLLLGFCLSLAIQLHYISLIFVAGVYIVIFFKIRLVSNKKKFIKNSLLSLATCLFFLLPLFLFDIRHNFINSSALIKLFVSGELTGGSRARSLLETISAFFRFSFSSEWSIWLSLAIFFALIIAFFILIANKSYISYILFIFIISIFSLSFYSGPKHPHYFAFIYPIFYIIVAFILVKVFSGRTSLVIIFFVTLFIFENGKNYKFFFAKAPNQIQHAVSVASVINKNIVKMPYMLTAVPDNESDSMYRYFLEIWGKPALEKNSLEKAQELFVVCNNICNPIGQPQWEIAYFSPTKITHKWSVNNVTIYRLIHE